MTIAPAHRSNHVLRDLAAVVALVLIWGGAAAAALAVAALTRIGPIVLILSYSHGIHTGDLMAGALFAGFAAVLSAMLVRWWRDR